MLATQSPVQQIVERCQELFEDLDFKAVQEWKAKRQAELLELRAEDAESYADATTAIAEAAIEEARTAALEAIEARREADEAAAAH